ncbi:hypothetical protein DOTSEDRAFT_75731 [Dothistroma septosporum NZE10]|uniref:Uncharacterized protein n=1 Tax=Dothistroma septosporum (strain NZE10 / CBS 128990) TaxID=675120 RepID=N1PBG4_DOTSN|nr:hypothetical protein DOTSEDRAFT_75731 [Dothistroma septosporum NZE10]
MVADTEETAKNRLHNDRSGCHRLCIWSSETSQNILRRYFEACNVMVRAKSTSATRPNVPDLIEPLRIWARQWRHDLLDGTSGTCGATPPNSSSRQPFCPRRDLNRSWRTPGPSVIRRKDQDPPTMVEPAIHRNIRMELGLSPRQSMADSGIGAPLVQPNAFPAVPTNEAAAVRRHNTGDSGVAVGAAPHHMQRISSRIERAQDRYPTTIVQPFPRPTEHFPSAGESAQVEPASIPFVPARRPTAYERNRHELGRRVQTDMTLHFDERQRQVSDGLEWTELRGIWSPLWMPSARASETRSAAIATNLCRQLQEVFGVGNEEILHPPHPDRRVWLANLGRDTR